MSGRGGGAEHPGNPILVKHGKQEPAEMKSQGHQGRKRAGGILPKIQDSDEPETQPPIFTLG